MLAALGNGRYGYIVVDAPALLSAREAWLIARGADGAIVVCPDHPEADELGAARKALEALDVRLLGAVVTAPVPRRGPDREPEPVPEPEADREREPEREQAPEPAAASQAADDPAELAAANGGPAPALEAQVLLDCLRSASGPLTFSQVREALGGPPATRVRTHLRRLVDGGEVVRTGSGLRGDPYLYGPPGD
jgi:hypothetical protein